MKKHKIDDLKIKQGGLFYIFYLIIPLVIPSLIMFSVALFYPITWSIFVGLLLPQIFLYNTVMLSINIGLLYLNKEDDSSNKSHTGYSICLVLLNFALFWLVIFLNFSKIETFKVFSFPQISPITLFNIFLFISFILIYTTLLLLNKNPSVSFTELELGDSAQGREVGIKEIIKKIVGRQ